jgi:glycosyltransferase involved in cell wall biosynthesis
MLLITAAWNAPFARRMAASLLYDWLYAVYRQAFRSILRAHIDAADVVHTFSTGYLSRLAIEECRRANKPVVASPTAHFGQWGDSPAQVRAYCRADAVTCPTHGFARRFRQRSDCPGVNILVLPPLSPVTGRTGRTPALITGDAPFVLFIGRRAPYKGLDLLIDAFRHAAFDAWRLVIAGPGATVSGDARIVDLGEVADEEKLWLLRRCSIFCLPSSSESFGLVIAEAMQQGRPVLGLDVEPVNELIQDGVTGRCVPPGSAAMLAGALEQLMVDADLRKRLGSAARERYRRLYSREQTIGDLAALYDTLTQQIRDSGAGLSGES